MMLRCSQGGSLLGQKERGRGEMMALTCAPLDTEIGEGGEPDDWRGHYQEGLAMAAAEAWSHPFDPKRVAMMQVIMRAHSSLFFDVCSSLQGRFPGSQFWDWRKVMIGMCPG